MMILVMKMFKINRPLCFYFFWKNSWVCPTSHNMCSKMPRRVRGGPVLLEDPLALEGGGREGVDHDGEALDADAVEALLGAVSVHIDPALIRDVAEVLLFGEVDLVGVEGRSVFFAKPALGRDRGSCCGGGCPWRTRSGSGAACR